MVDAAVVELADRIRALLGGAGEIEERAMFGSRAFLSDGHILVGARKGGALLVRVGAERAAMLLTERGVTRAVMGARTMSENWLDVSPDAIADDAALMHWIDVAREDAGAA
ncbi:TfoX/Sxy family protein [Microbacterium sp. 13-71-7]|jgi:TfoX/Sxy family transcriptional regulator of competence genes|uniref:TfoX/Sxy family protein n=1 Tax=Microbacterium sp. 13-71-7 TaxID=1970399 RepID=UPI0025E4F3B3|nr:TfoX/Sxy family protein [Microbacterium sp. 13-71-7]